MTGTGRDPSDIVDDAIEKATRPTVVVHADLAFLAGGEGDAELDLLGPISREVANRLACDAHIILSADDAEGKSIQQGGARRSPTPQQRIEIRRRDKGCRFPGCTYTEFTDVHHVIPWPAGGPTDIWNLVTLCDAHHRSVHEFGLENVRRRQPGAHVQEPDRTDHDLECPHRPSPEGETDRLVDRIVQGNVFRPARHLDAQ